VAIPGIILASSAEQRAEALALWERVGSSWPSPSPQAYFVEISQLADALIAQSEGESTSRVQGVVVLLEADTPAATAIALAHLLRDAMAYGFILMPGMSAELRGQISGGGLTGADSALSPEALATSLAALEGRQDAVEVLQREIRILSSFQGGVRQEMDRMHEELNLAAVIQQELLPAELPEAKELDFGVMGELVLEGVFAIVEGCHRGLRSGLSAGRGKV